MSKIEQELWVRREWFVVSYSPRGCILSRLGRHDGQAEVGLLLSHPQPRSRKNEQEVRPTYKPQGWPSVTHFLQQGSIYHLQVLEPSHMVSPTGAQGFNTWHYGEQKVTSVSNRSGHQFSLVLNLALKRSLQYGRTLCVETQCDGSSPAQPASLCGPFRQ